MNPQQKLMNMQPLELTQQRLKELFFYDPLVGDLIRIKTICHNAKIGDIVGHNNGNGYFDASVDGAKYYTHRLAWLYVYGEFPKGHIDHLNHNRFDNRIKNLRDVTRAENMRNISNKNVDIFGVKWSEERKRWVARIGVDGKAKTLGRFSSFFDACCCRKSAELKYKYHKNHGDLPLTLRP